MKVLFISLGCDKNLVDSEYMLGLLRDADFTITDDEAEAEIIVINTCCFIHDAKEESIKTILTMAQQKQTGVCKVLAVTGCLAQRYQDEIRKEIPEVDMVLGTTAGEQLVASIKRALTGEKDTVLTDIQYLCVPETNRVLTAQAGYSYLKIAEGCDKHCTYCVIPSLRGNYRSVPMERLLEEAKQIAASGNSELILVAQETTLYGTDIYKKKMLPELLHQLAKIEGIEWIRILYCYPEEITAELIHAIKTEPKVCHYLDIPMQHASDSVLRRMGRRTNAEALDTLIQKLRAEIPDIVIRTTFITGFPGETGRDFQILKKFIERHRFERLGVFTYSKEENTPAASMRHQIPEWLKKLRRKILMKMQQRISAQIAKNCIGNEYDVMNEGTLADEKVSVGRTYMDAPNVDGYVFVQGTDTALSGTRMRVKITDAKEYDLIGEKIL